jgi:hypothetical protein
LLPIQPLQQMIMTVTDGSVERGENGLLGAHLWTLVPVQSLQELNEKLGLDQRWLTSESTVISIDSGQPTVFENEKRMFLPKGTAVLNPTNWTETEMMMNVTAVVRTRAAGYLAGRVFTGQFLAATTYEE